MLVFITIFLCRENMEIQVDKTLILFNLKINLKLNETTGCICTYYYIPRHNKKYIGNGTQYTVSKVGYIFVFRSNQFNCNKTIIKSYLSRDSGR